MEPGQNGLKQYPFWVPKVNVLKGDKKHRSARFNRIKMNLTQDTKMKVSIKTFGCPDFDGNLWEVRTAKVLGLMK